MWSDRETIQDCLGFQVYVGSLADVCLEPDIAPLTLGVFASWGGGKTSLMRMLEKEIKERRTDTRKLVTVWANAWRYENRDEMQSALIHAILDGIRTEIDLLTELKEEAKSKLKSLLSKAGVLKLGKVLLKSAITLSPDIAGIADLLSSESQKLATTMAEFERDFAELVGLAKIERIVVFIDDLDRCMSTQVVETFETVKLFLNTPECAFVIGADSIRISDSIREHYKIPDKPQEGAGRGKRTHADDYLEKIVQVPFRIPEQDLDDISCYVGMLTLQRRLTSTGWQGLLKARAEIRHAKANQAAFEGWLAKQGDQLFPEKKAEALKAVAATLPFVPMLAQGLRGNPRQLKRFLNILELRKRIARANKISVDADVLIKLLIVEYTWAEVFASVVSTYDPASGSSELLNELAALHKKGIDVDEQSALLSGVLKDSALVEFVVAAPDLCGVNLAPYLFLAQTSLSGQPPKLEPIDEVVRGLVGGICNPDRIRSKSAALRASSADSKIVESVMKALAVQVPDITDKAVQVRALNGVAVICGKRKEMYGLAVSLLEGMSFEGNEASAVVAMGILAAAEKAGKGNEALRKKLESVSKIGAALSGKKK